MDGRNERLRVGPRTIATPPKEILKLSAAVLERTDGNEILPNQKTMKTNLLCKISAICAMIFSRPSSARLRLAAAGTLFLAAAGLAATAAMHPPKLPWAVPTVKVGNAPGGV